MLRAYKYRLYPSKAQAKLLGATLEECRWLYNNTLSYRKQAWETQKRHADWHETKRRIPILKQQRAWLKDVYSQVLQNVTERVDLAYKAFFRRVAGGETPGYPRFKGKGRYDSFTYTQTGFKLDGSHLQLSKIGRVWLVLHRPIAGTVKTLTIRRSSTGKWYACFTAELPEPLPS
ncbi:MAG: transposase, partial [Gemmatimonadaceae bacterium]|nr:transposase [Gloeobacterales cyanobacterium ES-bin-141]